MSKLLSGGPMPPSGFIQREADAVDIVLTSCVNRLALDAVGRGETWTQALAREIDTIDAILEAGPTKRQRHFLGLVREHYEVIISREPNSMKELQEANLFALEVFDREILAIKAIEPTTA